MREDVYTCDLCGAKSSDVNNTRGYKGVEIAVNKPVTGDSLPVVVALCTLSYIGIPLPPQPKHLCECCITSIARIKEGL
jgi:hypothetical protein